MPDQSAPGTIEHRRLYFGGERWSALVMGGKSPPIALDEADPGVALNIAAQARSIRLAGVVRRSVG
jgi:hypothetical protein